jgi:hypothetical protein
MKPLEANYAWTVTAPIDSATDSAILVNKVSDDAVILTAVGKDHNCYSVAVFEQPTASGANTINAGTYYYVVKSTTANAPYQCGNAPLPVSNAAINQGAAVGGTAATAQWGLNW